MKALIDIRSVLAKALALVGAVALTATVATAGPQAVMADEPQPQLTADADASADEQLDIAPSGLPSKTAPFDQTVAYFLWPYQWGTQNVGTATNPKQGDVEAGEYGWKGPGTRPVKENMDSLEEQIKLVKESGMTYVKTSYFISPLNAADPSCNQSIPGDCSPSTDLPDKIIQKILDEGLKPVIYFSQGNPDAKAVANPDPNQVYKTVPSFTKQQVKDTISHAIQKFAGKGIIWEAFNEPESEEHWPGGNNKDEAKIQWIELDQFIGDTIQQYDPNAAYVWGNFSGPQKLGQYQTEMKAAHATALSGHGYWINSPEGPWTGGSVGGYDYMDSEFGCSAGNTETTWSCGFNGIPKDSRLQGIWLIRQLLVKDIRGLNLASPYRMVGYDSFNINEDNDAANPGAVKTTESYDIIKNVTLALKGYRYVDGTFQNQDGVYRAVYQNGNKRKLVYWTADKPTLKNYNATKTATLTYSGQTVTVTATAVPQTIGLAASTALDNLTAWADTDGKAIQAHGGSVLKDGDTFYWVGQGAPDNVPTDYNGAGGVFANQWLYTTINMYKSQDLINWQFAKAVTSIDDDNAIEYCDGNVKGSTSKVLNYNDSRQQYKNLVTAHPQYLTNPTLGCKIERPHILKNAKTGKYLIWAHWEGTVGYGSSQLVAFQSDTVDGKYQPIKWQDGQVHAQPKVMIDGKLTPVASRDLSAWADPDTGKAYIVSSTEKVRLYRLNDDYTGIDPEGSYEFPGVSFREAPSLFKEQGRYYMITSGQDYWDPTQTEYASTSNLEDPYGWTKLTELQSKSDARVNWGSQDPSTRSYIGQPTYVMQYTDSAGNPAVMLLADDWNPLKSKTADVDTTKANYVITPVVRKGGRQLETPYQASVAPMSAGQKTLPVATSVAPLENVITATDIKPELPATATVTWDDGTTSEEAVTWASYDSYPQVGLYPLEGSVAGTDIKAKVTVDVRPKNNDATLKTLTIAGASVDLTAAASLEGAKLAVPNPDATLIRRDVVTKVNGAGAQVEVTFSKRHVSVKVTSSDGTATKTYEVALVYDATFTDVNADTAHSDDITWLAETGISTGWVNSDTTKEFRPMGTVVRQDMAAFLARLSGTTDYKPTSGDQSRYTANGDVTAHRNEVLWMSNRGITRGYADGTFGGLRDVSRQDLAAFLYRLAGSPAFNASDTVNAFTDVTLSTPHYQEIQWLASTGISEGWDVAGGKEFRPGATVTRQDMAAFLHRAFDKGLVKTDLPENPFADVTPGDGAVHADDVIWTFNQGISTGFADATFRGTGTVLRQDMAAFLYRASGSPDYTPSDADKAMFLDVNDSTPHAKEIWWLASKGISEGWEVPGGKEFRPGATVTRQDMAAFLYRAAGSPDYTPSDADKAMFLDVNDSTSHAKEVWWLASKGISEGWEVPGGKEFRGMDTVLRQDMAAFLHRFVTAYPHE